MSDDESLLGEEVLSVTDELVRQALNGSWSQLLDTMAQRRALLENLCAGMEWLEGDGLLAALAAAMAESEQAMTRVFAHAMADLSRAYSPSSILH